MVLLIFSPETYDFLDGEDGPIEWVGFFFLFLTGVTLFQSGWKCRVEKIHAQYVGYTLMIVGLVFLWAAGEEISWGQRLFGVETPIWLKDINGQGEMNLHNINKKFFDRALERVNLLLVLLSFVLHFKGCEKVLGFRVPDIPLTCAFLLLPFYDQYKSFSWEFHQIGILVLIGYTYLSLRNKGKLLKFFVATWIGIASLVVVHWIFQDHFYNNNIHNEFRESFFAFLCWTYALQLSFDFSKNRNQ